MPDLIINGERRSFPAGEFPATIEQLLLLLKFDPAQIIAEVDGELVARAAFATGALRPEQTVELVRFVGGG